MPITTRVLTEQLQGGIGSSTDRRNRRVLIAEWSGRISSVDATGAYAVLGSGYEQLEDIEVGASGGWAIVTQRDGTVLRVDLDDADRARAEVIAAGLRAPHQVVLVRDRFAYTVEHARSGRLVALDLRSGALETLADGFRRAVGLALSNDLTTAYVSEQGSAGGSVTEVVLATGARRTLARDLTNPFMLTWSSDERSSLLVAERDPANRITEVKLRRFRPPIISRPPIVTRPPFRIDDPFGRPRPGRPWQIERFLPAPTSSFFEPTPARPSSVQRTDFGDVIISDSTATLITVGVQANVAFEVGGPMFPGEYRRLGVKTSGIAFDDLEFVAGPDLELGRVSYSRDDRFDPLEPDVMALAGSRLGAWTIEARRRSDGEVVGVAELENTDVWVGSDGPPIWFEGISQPDVVTGSAWGGGPSGPQNIDIHPQLGTRRVAMVLVDTSESRFPTDASATVQLWEDELINGVPVGGTTRSVKQFFNEVSGLVDDGSGTMVPRFDISLVGDRGPVALTGDWDDYFEPISDTDARWRFKTALIQAAATASDDVIDFSQVDSFVVVVKTVPGTGSDADKMAWPFASGMMITTADGDRNVRFAVMPHDWKAQDGREVHETLAHEIGHNLGLPDLYMDSTGFGAIADRDVDGWDLMSDDGRFGHFTTPFKMRLGWIAADDVKTFNFVNSGATSEEVELHASSLGTPPPGRFSAVEVRIADGRNYYFEYRSEQGLGIGDEDLETDRRVVGTDVILSDFTSPVVRRQVILLGDDADGDGPVLDVGDDYDETDITSATPVDFKVEVLDSDDDWARIRVSYGANSQPDPAIRPWPGSGTNAWQSPDIEVFNDKNLVDAEFRNLPWTGHSNRIVARVTNQGNLLASDVRVEFSVKDFTVGEPTVTLLGSDTRDIPAGDTVEFEFDGWVPPAGGHFCVIARIPLHINSDALATPEITELNNRAQSNYSEFISAEASPPRRQRTLITVANPYSVPTTAYLSPSQTNPFYRSYLATSQIHLGPGEERQVEMMFEALHNTPDMDRVLRDQQPDDLLRVPNRIGVAGLIDDPFDRESHHPLPTGGADIRVRTGVRTEVMAWDDGGVVGGRVIASDSSKVTAGRVIVTLREPGADRDIATEVAEVDNGSFFVQFSSGVDGSGYEAAVEYLGAGRWAPSAPFEFVT